MSEAQFSLPATPVSKELIERVQFSVSSRNASAKVSECLTHVFVSPLCDDPSEISWQYVSSGVTCLLRKRELSKNGRKLVWTIHMCLYNATYGVLVWKGAIAPNAGYTAVAGNFHVYAMHEMNAIVGLLIDETSQARDMLRVYLEWNAEITKEQRGKGGGDPASPAARFKKEMISKPCNFQHIQGTQALDECMEIEKIKTDIQAAFFGLGLRRGRNETDAGSASKRTPSHGKRKKDAAKPQLQFQNISVPHKMTSRTHLQSTRSLDWESGPLARSVPELKSHNSVPGGTGGPLRHSLPPQTRINFSDTDMVNGYPQRYSYGQDVAPHTPSLEPQNGYGYEQNSTSTPSEEYVPSPPVVSIDASVDSEVAGYNTVASQGSSDGLDYPPPERLSPLDFEKEFSESAFFQPSLMTSTTNC